MENGVRFASVWRGLSGVERADVEEVEFDAVAGAVGELLGTTGGTGGGGGGGWVWGWCGRCWRPTRRGWTARSTARRWPRCPGPGTARDILTPSMTRWRGWRCTRRGPRWRR